MLAGALAFAGTAFAQVSDKLNDKNGMPETTTAATGPDFGDDASKYASDGECDDPRFTGDGASKRPRAEDAMHDATDCRAAYEAGTVAFEGGPTTKTTTAGIDYGDNSSTMPMTTSATTRASKATGSTRSCSRATWATTPTTARRWSRPVRSR